MMGLPNIYAMNRSQTTIMKGDIALKVGKAKMADHKGECVKVGENGSLPLDSPGAKVTSDAGLLAYRDLDAALEIIR